jgi:hypothetical protein
MIRYENLRMSPRTVDLVVAVGLLLVGLVPIAWPGMGPTVLSVLLWIAGMVSPVMAARV